ncbi:ribose-phosphate diphosphokinase [Ureaplasma ceti]
METNLNNKTILFGLSASEGLADAVAKKLGTELSPIKIQRFADGEILVAPQVSVRGRDVAIIQSVCNPVNENLMELLIAIDAVRRSSARSINVIIPYIGYARQDRKTGPREPITFKLVANMLQASGATRILTFDIHSDQTQGFFDIPFDSMRLSIFLLNEFIKDKDLFDFVVVSPDYGGIKRARTISTLVNKPLAIIDKRRPSPNQVEIKNILGDVKDKDCLIFDDMIDTGGTMLASAKLLKEHGARTVSILVTHGLFNGNAAERFNEAYDQGYINNVLVTDTIERPIGIKCLKVVSVDHIIADVIKLFTEETGAMSEIIKRNTQELSCKIQIELDKRN